MEPSAPASEGDASKCIYEAVMNGPVARHKKHRLRLKNEGRIPGRARRPARTGAIHLLRMINSMSSVAEL
jgi:hypothetical protein